MKLILGLLVLLVATQTESFRLPPTPYGSYGSPIGGSGSLLRIFDIFWPRTNHIEAESLFNAMNEALDAIDNLKIYKPKVPKSSKDYLRIISNKAGETGQGQFGVRMM